MRKLISWSVLLLGVDVSILIVCMLSSCGGGNAAHAAVSKASPSITWTQPVAITNPAPLTLTQLNATASVPGSFVYTPPAGTVLAAGAQTLSVTFTPADTTNYTTATASVTLTVNSAPPVKTTPTVTWLQPAPITNPAPLSATQLDATTSVPGTFVYTPSAGTVLTAGTQTLSVMFTPADATNYTTATASVSLTVNPPAFPFIYFLGYQSVFGYRVDPSTGNTVAIPGSPFSTGSTGWPQFYNVDRSNRHLSVQNEPGFARGASFGNNDISVFDIDQLTGALSAVKDSPFADWGSMYLDQNSNYVYSQASNQYQLGTFNDQSGSIVFGSNFQNLSHVGRFIAPFSNLQYVYEISLLGDTMYALTRAGNGTLTEVNSIPVNLSLYGDVIMDPQGTCVLADVRSSNPAVYSFLVQSGGTLEEKSVLTPGYLPSSLVTDHQGRFLYYTGSNGFYELWGYKINRNDCSLTPIAGSPFQIEGNPTIDSSDQYMYVTVQGNIFGSKIDQTSGAITPQY